MPAPRGGGDPRARIVARDLGCLAGAHPGERPADGGERPEAHPDLDDDGGEQPHAEKGERGTHRSGESAGVLLDLRAVDRDGEDDGCARPRQQQRAGQDDELLVVHERYLDELTAWYDANVP